MLDFFRSIANMIFYIGFNLGQRNLFYVVNPFGSGSLGISILDIMVGLVVLSIIISIFWRGAKG